MIKMKKDKKDTVRDLSIKEIHMMILDKMDDEKAELLLRGYSNDYICKMFREEETLNTAREGIKKAITTYESLLQALENIPVMIADRDNILKERALESYSKLSSDTKKEFCSEIYKSNEFKRDFCAVVDREYASN